MFSLHVRWMVIVIVQYSRHHTTLSLCPLIDEYIYVKFNLFLHFRAWQRKLHAIVKNPEQKANVCGYYLMREMQTRFIATETTFVTYWSTWQLKFIEYYNSEYHQRPGKLIIIIINVCLYVKHMHMRYLCCKLPCAERIGYLVVVWLLVLNCVTHEVNQNFDTLYLIKRTHCSNHTYFLF